MARLDSLARGLKGPCPTLQGQNVYVSCPRRIRFTLETYTFSPQNVYVLLAIRTRCDQAGYTFDGAALCIGRSTDGGWRWEGGVDYGGRRIAFLGKDEGEGITSLGQLVWTEGEGGA